LPPTRQEIESRLQALLADHLDAVATQNPEGFDIGVIAIVTEVRYPASVEEVEELVESRGRPEAFYTPEAEWNTYVAMGCSDSRNWIQGGILNAALDLLDEPAIDVDDEDPE
jgi:hypothetical protein